MRICGVDKNSVGRSLGLKPGDVVLAFDGFQAEDILDYEFYDAAESFTLKVRAKNGEREFLVEKDSEETLGLSFEGDGIQIKTCRNRCIFCFVDQLPPDNPDAALRQTLRVKDDDYRLSFLNGTYITLTNLTDSDIARIKRLKLSPLYVSVHTTDEPLRRKMLGVTKSRPVFPLIQELHGAGIRLHTQTVYCPGYNEDIEKTARELFPYCESLAVVPAGLTQFQNPGLRAVTKADARKMIALVEKLQPEFLTQKDTRFVWAADEFYLKADIALPKPETYENYPQIENGVGLFAKFDEDFAYGLQQAKRKNKRRDGSKITNYKLQIANTDVVSASNINPNEAVGVDLQIDPKKTEIDGSICKSTPTEPLPASHPSQPNHPPTEAPHSSLLIPHSTLSISFATGVSAYPFIQQKAQILSDAFGLQIHVYPVENRFFGSSVTVAGLLTGGDIARELKGKPLGERLLLPSVMFREGGDEFLDNMTLSELSAILGVSIEKIPADGESFVLATHNAQRTAHSAQ